MTKSMELSLVKLVWSIKGWPKMCCQERLPFTFHSQHRLSCINAHTHTHTHTLQSRRTGFNSLLSPTLYIPSDLMLSLSPSPSFHIFFSLWIAFFFKLIFIFLPLSPPPQPILYTLPFLLILCPVILAREWVICIIWIILICHPGGNGKWSLSPHTLQESGNSNNRELRGDVEAIY